MVRDGPKRPLLVDKVARNLTSGGVFCCPNRGGVSVRVVPALSARAGTHQTQGSAPRLVDAHVCRWRDEDGDAQQLRSRH